MVNWRTRGHLTANDVQIFLRNKERMFSISGSREEGVARSTRRTTTAYFIKSKDYGTSFILIGKGRETEDLNCKSAKNRISEKEVVEEGRTRTLGPYVKLEPRRKVLREIKKSLQSLERQRNNW